MDKKINLNMEKRKHRGIKMTDMEFELAGEVAIREGFVTKNDGANVSELARYLLRREHDWVIKGLKPERR